MTTSWERHYDIIPEAGGLLADCDYRYHEFHYKNGQASFDAWLRQASKYKGERIRLSDYKPLADLCMTRGREITPGALYDLERWLRGRQFCYAHHLLQRNADDGHFHMICLAKELLMIFKADKAPEIIVRCTPTNLSELVHEFAMFEEQGQYPLPATRTGAAHPATRVKRRRNMTKTTTRQSWNRVSDSKSSSPLSGARRILQRPPRPVTNPEVEHEIAVDSLLQLPCLLYQAGGAFYPIPLPTYSPQPYLDPLATQELPWVMPLQA